MHPPCEKHDKMECYECAQEAIIALADKLHAAEERKAEYKKALEKACSYHELGQVVSLEDDAYFKAILSTPPKDTAAELPTPVEGFVPYSTDERGYPHMAIDEHGRGKLLLLTAGATGQIVQHGVSNPTQEQP